MYGTRHRSPTRESPEHSPMSEATGNHTAEGRWQRLLRSVAVDVGPLRRHRDFRLLFIGQAVSFFGSMISYVALPYQAYALSHSSLAVGLLGICELVPLLIFAFLGGALADAVDRRQMVRLTELLLASMTGVLVV